jgi:hypothetical protein
VQEITPKLIFFFSNNFSLFFIWKLVRWSLK